MVVIVVAVWCGGDGGGVVVMWCGGSGDVAW